MACRGPMNQSGEVQIGEYCEKLSPIHAIVGKGRKSLSSKRCSSV
jgi:hypothetical protein